MSSQRRPRRRETAAASSRPGLRGRRVSAIALLSLLLLAEGGAAGSSAGLYAAACDGSLAPVRVGTVSDRRLDEISGVVASRRHPGVLWVHEDSGGGTRVYAIRTTGRTVGSIDVQRAGAVDWEDIALGPGPGDRDFLYLADIGDNDERRRAIAVYRFPEPSPTASSARATRIELRYPDGRHDAEALLVDPRDGTILVLTKGFGGASLYRAPPAGGMLRRVGRVATLAPVTAADLSPDGGLVVLRTYLDVSVFQVPSGGGIVSALAGAGCAVPLLRGQGEALAVSATGRALLAISEGERPAIVRLR